MNMPTLYKRSKTGAVVQWSVSVDGTTMTTSHGQKNLISESTEFPTHEKALSEAGSRYRHKLKLKYTEDPSGISALAYVRPMLALKYMQHRSKVDWSKALAQPKLNGVRCVAWRIGDSILFTSRNGTPFVGLGFLVPELLSMMPDQGMWDGELFNPELSLQEIVSLVRRSVNMKPEEVAAKIQYHVFDAIEEGIGFADRYAELFNQVRETGSVRLVPWDRVTSEDHCTNLLGRYLVQGYEGLMVRGEDSLYLPEHRSQDLLKYKIMQDEEFMICGYRRGSGKDKDIPIFECVTEEGKKFGVRMEGTYAANKERLLIADSLIGKLLTVRFQEYTPDGVPEFPVGVEIRDYE